MVVIKKIESIQILRFILAGCVVVQHTGQQIINVYYPRNQYFLKNHKLYYIELAVAAFIAISGVVMYFSMKKEGVTARNFIINRFIRIYPLYFFMTVIYFALYKVSGKVPLGIDEFGKSLLFLSKQPIVAVAWSLNIEVYFYILCFLALCLNYKKAIKIILILLSIIFLFELYFVIFPPQKELLNIPIIYSFLYYKMIVVYFVIGIVIAYLYDKKYLLKPYMHLLFIFLGAVSGYFLTFSNAQSYWTIYFVFPAFLIVYGCIGLKISEKYHKVIEYLGNLSYSMYLSHSIIIFLAAKMMKYTTVKHLSIMSYLYYFIIFSSTLLVSMLLYKYVEVPCSKKLRKIVMNRLKA